MQRVADTRNPSKDLFGAGKNGFRPGDASGTPATTPGYELFNAWQEELCYPIEAMGLTLDPTNKTQLYTAMMLMIQLKTSSVATDTGKANAYVGAYTPAITQRKHGMILRLQVITNNTDTSTFNDGLGAVGVVSMAGVALQGGELVATGTATLMWDATLSKYVLLYCTLAAMAVVKATKSKHAVNLGQLQDGSVGLTLATLFLGAQADDGSGALIQTSQPVSVGSATKSQHAVTLGQLNTAMLTTLQVNGQGSIGLGTTPKTWGGGQYPVVQINARTSVTGDANSSYFSTNLYVNATPSIVYLSAGYALRYSQSASDGYHRWQTAVSGAADAAITLSTVMQIDPAGVLTVPGGIASIPACRGAHSNLLIGYTGTSGVVTVTANELVLENSSNVYQTLRNVNVSATSGSTTAAAGGLDTGSWAFGTLYHLFVVYNPTTSTTALLWSLSATAPTLPAGYTSWARIGANKTQSATNYWFLGGVQAGRKFRYKVVAGSNVTALPILVSGAQGSISAPTYVSASVSGYVPATAVVVSVSMFCSSGTVAVAPNGGYGAYTSTTTPPPMAYSATSTTISMPSEILLESTNIYYCSSVAASGVTLLGWEDNL